LPGDLADKKPAEMIPLSDLILQTSICYVNMWLTASLQLRAVLTPVTAQATETHPKPIENGQK
jgi:hypothetical protein